MSNNARLFLLFALQILLFFGIGLVNSFAARFSVYLHLDALLLVFFGLFLRRTGSLVYVVILGLLAEAMHPVPAGTYLLGYLGLWSFFVWSQKRIRAQNPLQVRSITTAAQILWLLVLTFTLGGEHLLNRLYWQRVLVDLLASGLLIYAMAWPWCSLQKKILYSLGWNLDAQLSGS